MLRDHFHPPLSRRRPWHALHHGWATAIAAQLNERLPEGWFAAPHVQFGFEIDVASVEETELVGASTSSLSSEAGAAAWSPPAPTLTIDFPGASDRVEVEVYLESEELQLAGAIELVSPANKDRHEHRDAFLSKCETLLHGGIGLLVVDIVTSRRFNFDKALLKRFRERGATDAQLYAAAYHPVERDERPSLDVWSQPLELDQPLPVLPLHLLHGPCVPVDLNETYNRACREQRIPPT